MQKTFFHILGGKYCHNIPTRTPQIFDGTTSVKYFGGVDLVADHPEQSSLHRTLGL